MKNSITAARPATPALAHTRPGTGLSIIAKEN